MATIKDIAKISGYSIGTVSRVLNHHPDVSEKTKQRIEEVIRELNYEPNSNAKMLKQGSNSAITLIIRGYHNLFLQNILEEMQLALRKAGEPTSVAFVDENANEVQAALHLSASMRPKGFFFLGGNLGDFREYFSEISVPSVLLTNSARELDFPNLSSFATDDVAAAAYAIHYLYDCGHRTIGVIGGAAGNTESQAGYLRRQGCVRALRECGLTPEDDLYVPSRFSMEGGYTATRELLGRRRDVTAVFALSDMIAIGAIRAIRDMGLDCPGDISVMGFDGLEICQFGVPRLTTIRQNVELLSSISVSNLLLHLHYPQNGPAHEIVPFQLQKGESVAKI
jgi:LacI family transcriptional regulator